MRKPYLFLAGAVLLGGGLWLWVNEPQSNSARTSASGSAKVNVPSDVPVRPANAPVDSPRDARANVYVRNEDVFDMTRPLHDRLDDLVEEASESPSTTYDVGTVVASCAAVPQGDAPVEGMVSQGTDGAIRAAGQVLDQQDFCAGLELTDFETGLAMLDRAAASGLVEAQVNYVDLANVILYSQDELRLDLGRQDTYRRKAIHYLNQAAQAGNAVAYANLSQVYSEGRLTPPDAGLAARYYREYLQRSGRTSERDLKHLEALEAAAD